MSLESDIQTLNKSVRELIEALNSYGVRANNAEVVKRLEETRQNAYQGEETPNDQPQPTKPSTTTDTSPPSSDESRTVTYDDVKKITIKVSTADRKKAEAGLARFGVKTAKDLTQEQWASYVTYMGKVAAGELDPESSHE